MGLHLLFLWRFYIHTDKNRVQLVTLSCHSCDLARSVICIASESQNLLFGARCDMSENHGVRAPLEVEFMERQSSRWFQDTWPQRQWQIVPGALWWSPWEHPTRKSLHFALSEKLHYASTTPADQAFLNWLGRRKLLTTPTKDNFLIV